MLTYRTATYFHRDNDAPFTLTLRDGEVPRPLLIIDGARFTLRLVQTLYVDDVADAERRIAQQRAQIESLERELGNAHQLLDEHDHESARIRLERDAESILAPAVEPSQLRRVS